MAKNQGAGFGRMDPDERENFAESQPLGAPRPEPDEPGELEFEADTPRDADTMGRHRASEEPTDEEREADEAGVHGISRPPGVRKQR